MTQASQNEAGEATQDSSKKKSKVLLIVMIVGPLLLLGIGGGVAYFMGFFGSKKAEQTDSHGKIEGKEGKDNAKAGEPSEGKEGGTSTEGRGKESPHSSVFQQLPEMMINLNAEGNKVSYLKLQVTLELDDQKNVEKIQKLLPRLQDIIQVYVRELKVADLRSAIGVEKLRSELLKRIQLIAKDVKIYDILFPQMLTQ